jgi:inhibitor of cysteine peptidase
MGRRLSAWAFTALVFAASVACQSSAQPSDPSVIIAPIQIDSVELVHGLAVPSGLGVHVKGIVGDGCSELRPVRQSREGALVTITLESERPKDAICTQIAKLYDDVIPFEGAFSPGQYTVRVNTSELAFSVR